MNIGFWTYYNIIHNKNYLSNIKEHNVKKKKYVLLNDKTNECIFFNKKFKISNFMRNV